MQAAEAAKIGVKLLLSDQHSTASNPAYIHASNLQQALECLTQTTQSSVTTMNPLISKHIQQSIDCKQAILQSATCIQSIEDAAELCRQALQRGNKILIAGNGGSAADAQHIAAELVGRFEKERASMAAIAITTDTSALTAIANDYGYEFVFSRQVEGLGQAGDVFIGLSTSGNSANIVKAVEMAQLKNMHSISLCGAGGKLAELSEVNIAVPSARTAIIQESHIMIGHMLCALIEA
jgi:D-sedoheptulose 7-phosphate isomerase